MTESIEVIAVGSNVLLSDVISARVTAVFIRENRIAYEVTWWDDCERHEEVVEPWELRPDSEKARALRVDPVL